MFFLSSFAVFAGGTEMELIGKGFGPPAFNAFCHRNGALCSTGAGARIVHLDPSRRAELQRLNTEINHRIRERSDRVVYGVEDNWTLPGAAGDCEDFAILKKSELMKRGWPSAALLLTVARLRYSERGHVVLTVRTSDGDLVLDNRSNAVKDWSHTPYRYYARQAQKSAGWDRIGRPLSKSAGG